MADEEQFLGAIRANPGDETLRLVYADWLEDQGDSRSEYVRLLCALWKGKVPQDKVEASCARLEELRTGFDPLWMPLELVAEGRRLARPAIALADEGTEYAAIWQGEGVLPPPSGEWEHWISFDAHFLPDNPQNRSGILSVYLCREDSDRFHQLAVIHDPKARLPSKTDGQRLFAQHITCLPYIDALFRFGGKHIQGWLKANNWEKDWGYNGNFPDSTSIDEYDKFFRAEHPFFRDKEFAAMLGGWALVFDGDYWLLNRPLLLLTVRDSEPWLEVYEGEETFLGYARIT